MSEDLMASKNDGFYVEHLISASGTNANAVQAGNTQVFGWSICNTNASARYVKIYDKATPPTVGTDIPVATIMIPGSTSGAVVNQMSPMGIRLFTGLAFAITGGIADTDATGITANDVALNIYYV